MININRETKRILKALFTMNGEVALGNGVFGTSITYKHNKTFIDIGKSEDGKFYELEMIYDEDWSEVFGARFTTVSSLINYLKNNLE